MAYENIRFRRPNMTMADGYFYMFDDDWDTLTEKVDDGQVSFAYPLNTSLSSQVYSLEYDGINFWTLQDITGGVSIKRWKIDGSIVRLENTIDLSPDFNSDAFTVEHYHTTLNSTISGGDSNIQINRYYNTVVVSGSILTLGPNDSEEYEDVEVVSVSGTTITLASGIQYDYTAGDEVNFYNHLWVFNNTGAGTLHKIDARTGANITTYSGSEYDNVTACTFARVLGPSSSRVDTLMYVRSSANQLICLNINTMSNYGIADIDNIRADKSTIIPVYDIAVYGGAIYRLQDEATYYGVNNDWGSQYNYQVTPSRSFIDNITVAAYPEILPANATNISTITANVLDQYNRGAVYKPVFWTDDDDYGYITINPTYTDLFFGTGNSTTYYRAGVQVRKVTVTGRAIQYD